LITKTLTLDRFTSSVLIDENLSNDLLCRNLEFQNSKFGSRQGSLLGFFSRKPQTPGTHKRAKLIDCSHNKPSWGTFSCRQL